MESPGFSLKKTSYKDIQPLRKQFLSKNHFQIRYDACHWRGWADHYVCLAEGSPIGYGAVKGLDELSARDTIFEFYLRPEFEKWTHILLELLIKASQVTFMESQTNDSFLTALVFESCVEVQSDTILFGDITATAYSKPELKFRKYEKGENVFGKKEGDIGPYVLVKNGQIVADGGFLTHYNAPFADLYMEAKREERNKGYGRYILQEIKNECYRAGLIPAARCNMSNKPSKAALLGAGMEVCGFMLKGRLV